MTVLEIINAALQLDEDDRREVVRQLMPTLFEVPPGILCEDDPNFEQIIESRIKDAREGKNVISLTFEEFQQRAWRSNNG